MSIGHQGSLENLDVKVSKTLPTLVGPSDDLLHSADTEKSHNDISYQKQKEIQVGRSGIYRVKFDLKTITAGLGYGKIYKNGAQFGTERSQGTAWATYSEDLSFSEGDLIQLYSKHSSGSYAVYVRNFRLYGVVTGAEQLTVLD